MFTSHNYTTTSVQGPKKVSTNRRYWNQTLYICRYTPYYSVSRFSAGNARAIQSIYFINGRRFRHPLFSRATSWDTRGPRWWPNEDGTHVARVMVRKLWLTVMSRSKKCKKKNRMKESIIYKCAVYLLSGAKVNPLLTAHPIVSPKTARERINSLFPYYYYKDKKKLPNNNKDVYPRRVHSARCTSP